MIAYCYNTPDIIKWQSLMYVFLACFQKESVMVNSTDKDINTEKLRTSKMSQKGRALSLCSHRTEEWQDCPLKRLPSALSYFLCLGL